MPNFYINIGGQKYDRALYQAALDAVEGQGDGRISKADAEKLVTRVLDSRPGDTDVYKDVEKRTVALIRKTMGWTPAGDGTFRRAIRSDAARRSWEVRAALLRGSKPITLKLSSAPAGVTLERNGDVYSLCTKTPTLTWRDRAVVQVGDRVVELNGARGGAMTSNPLSRGAPIDHEWQKIDETTNADGSFTQRFRFVHDPKAITEKAALKLAREAIVDYLKNDRLDDRDWLDYFPGDWASAVRDGVMDGIETFGTDNMAYGERPETYRNDDDDIVTYAGRGPFMLYTEVSINKYTGDVTRAYVEID